MSTISRAMGLAGVSTALVLAGSLLAGPASAAETNEPFVVPTSTTYAAAVDLLEAQKENQSQTSIQSTIDLASEQVHVEQLVGENGDVVAALAVHKPKNTRAVWWESPGCSTTGACITSGGRQLGYAGVGELNGSWTGVTRIAAGSYTTGLWAGNVGQIVVKNSAKTYSKSISGSKIIR